MVQSVCKVQNIRESKRILLCLCMFYVWICIKWTNKQININFYTLYVGIGMCSWKNNLRWKIFKQLNLKSSQTKQSVILNYYIIKKEKKTIYCFVEKETILIRFPIEFGERVADSTIEYVWCQSSLSKRTAPMMTISSHIRFNLFSF